MKLELVFLLATFIDVVNTQTDVLNLYNEVNTTLKEQKLSFCYSACADTGTELIWMLDTFIYGYYDICPANEIGCFSCDCDQTCYAYGTCCIFQNDPNGYLSMGVLNTDIPDLVALEEEQFSNLSIQVECMTDSPPVPYLAVASCGQQYRNDETTRMKCEEQIVGQETQASYVHVTNMKTNVTYKNKDCATCNGVNQTETWGLSIECAHFLRVYEAVDYDEYLKLSLKPNSTCRITQIPPKEILLRECDPAWYGDVISSCNVTGLWEKFMPGMEESCAMQSPMLERVKTTDKFLGEVLLFNNYICALCNLDDLDIIRCKNPVYRNGADPVNPLPYRLPLLDPLPFSLLLGFADDGTPQVEYYDLELDPDVCSFMEWASPDGRCLKVNCAAGKVLNGNNTCATAISSIRGLGYKVALRLLTQPLHQGDAWSCKNLTYLDNQQTTRMAVLNETLKQIVRNIPIDDYDLDLLTANQNDTSREICEVFAVGYLVMNSSLDRDYVENLMLRGLVGNFTITNVSAPISLRFDIIPYEITSPILCVSSLTTGSCEAQIIGSIEGEGKLSKERSIILDDKELFLSISNTLNCSFVTLNSSDFDLEVVWHSDGLGIKITLYLGSYTVRFDNILDMIDLSLKDNGTKLDICRNLLDVKISEIQLARYLISSLSDIVFWQSLLTLICMGASIACLAFTVLIYILFSVLRSLAGWHNLFLSGTLLLAQCLLLASTYVHGPSPWCTALGMATHFMWLCMFCWSLACCGHMLMVFTAKTRPSVHGSARTQRLVFLKRVVLTILAPAVVIVGVVMGVYTATDGDDIGYGKRSCYLDSALLVGLATVLPLAVITVLNICFFAVVVWKIYGVRKLQTGDAVKKADKKNLFVYIRLSTLTGMCWTVAIIAEAADNDPLRFIYIFLNGLQGVFIFLSYTCNQRVMNLLTGKEKGKNYDSSQLSNTTSKTFRKSAATTEMSSTGSF